MIERFSILYAGHVDMDNIGYDGTPVNERFLSDEHLASALATTEDIAKAADRLGYNTLWLAEHHFQREGYECLPNLLMQFVHLSHLTKNIKFGCAFNVPPMWHPLRLAEDYALADHLTDGRIIFGLGRGYHTREVESFGSPMLDKEANRDLFEEQVEILFKAFNNRSFSHHGKYFDIPPKVPYRGYQLEEITLVPRPKHLPVECWQPIVSSSVRGIDFMVKHGIKAISGGGAAPGGAARAVVEAWRDAHARAGRETQLGEDLIIGEKFHIADSREKAIKEARPYFEENTKMFGPLGFVGGLTEEQKEDLENPTPELWETLPTIEDDVRVGQFLCGTPEQIIEPLMLLQDLYPGLREINIQPLISTPRNVILEQLERFAEEVMPAFKVAETRPAS
ncbi:MAG: LLM class flavin-dependent oxidoreductase [Chloroflexi bacterium]|nr:LLM class flavin-dependent oxidoreductase [Chloroflexota bacterium]